MNYDDWTEVGEGDDKVYLRLDKESGIINMRRSDDMVGQITERAFLILRSCIAEPCMACQIGVIAGVNFADLSNLTVFCGYCDAHFVPENDLVLKLVETS